MSPLCSQSTKTDSTRNQYRRIRKTEYKMNATHRPLARVTGASSGIGLMYATELARQGNDLVIVSNQEKELQVTSDKLTADFGEIGRASCSDIVEISVVAVSGKKKR